jgi:hypothetical protein
VSEGETLIERRQQHTAESFSLASSCVIVIERLTSKYRSTSVGEIHPLWESCIIFHCVGSRTCNTLLAKAMPDQKQPAMRYREESGIIIRDVSYSYAVTQYIPPASLSVSR